MPLKPGSDLGPYRIVESLGRGGMASVFVAHEAGLDRRVALKVLHPALLTDPQFAARFKREARVIAQLEHPNIVLVYAFGILDDTPWMAMRLLPGGSLADALRRGHLPQTRAIAILVGVAAALEHAHATLAVPTRPAPAMCMTETVAPQRTGRGVGLTPYQRGWVAVEIGEDGTARAVVEPTIAAAMARLQGAEPVLAQIPIGLREEGTAERSCDPLARRAIGHGSSVFPAPCRQAIYETTYEKASATNRRVTGRGLSMQSWGFAQRIREMDEYLQTHLSDSPRIREMHCDVGFWGLNGRRPLRHHQRTPEGRKERIDILRRHLPSVDTVLAKLMEAHRSSSVPPMRWLIALAGAVTAGAPPGQLCTLPEEPEKDARGLSMEMVFRAPSDGPPHATDVRSEGGAQRPDTRARGTAGVGRRGA